MNRVTLVGNLTRDPELRRTQSGMAVLSIGIAVNNRRKNQAGEWVDDPCFVDCSMFGDRAEKVSGYLHKGDKVAVDGKLRYSSWEKDGSRRSKLDVIIDNVDFMTRQNGAQGGYGQQAGGYAYGSGNAPQTPPQQPHGGYGYSQPQQYQQQAQPMSQQSTQVELAPSIYEEDIPFGG